MSKFTRIRNKTADFLVSIYQGTPIRFEPTGMEGAERIVPEAAAEKVLRDLGDRVEVLGEKKPVAKPTNFYGKTEWVANITGDPDEPKEVVVDKHYNKATGLHTPVTAPNSRHYPTSVVEFVDQVEEKVDSQIGSFTFTWPFQQYVLHSGERRELPLGIAKTFMEADQRSHIQGKVIRARAPLESDPSLSWSLEQLNAYFMLIEPAAPAFILKTEEDLKSAHRDAEGKINLDALLLAIEDQKYLMYKRCFRRAVDPKYNPPSIEDLKAFMGANRLKKTSPETSAKAAATAKQLVSD